MDEYKAQLDDSEWRIFLTGVTGKLKDIPKILSSAYGTFGYKDIMEHFRNESDENGRWKPWSDNYARAMQKKGKGGNKILQDTGMMRGSILPTNTRRISNTGIEVFANSEISAVHDSGGRFMPKRSFMWLSDKARNLMMQFIANFVWD